MNENDFDIRYDDSQPDNVCIYDTIRGLAMSGFESLDEAKEHEEDFIDILINWRF